MKPAGPTGEQLLMPVAADGLECCAPCWPRPARDWQRAACAQLLGDAVALALGLARADHDLVVGRARAGIGAVDDDLADLRLLCASAGGGERGEAGGKAAPRGER